MDEKDIPDNESSAEDEEPELDLLDEEPSEDDLENLEEYDEDELDDVEELDDDDQVIVDLDEAEESEDDGDDDVPVVPLVVDGFDSHDVEDEDEHDDQDDDDDDDDDEDYSNFEAGEELAAEVEDDLTQLLEDRLAEEDAASKSKSKGSAGKAAVAADVEWSCDECFLLVSASQFGSPKDPHCPSDEANCPLLKKVKVK